MAKLQKDNIDRFFDYDINIDSRTIYVGSASADDGDSGVDCIMAERLLKAIHLLEHAAPNGDKPITIITNNPGGDYLHGMAIYDAISTCESYVIIKGYGYAMSMGSIILQAADERIIAPNAKFMIHYGYESLSNHSKIFLKWAKEGQIVNRDMEEIYLTKMLQKDAKDSEAFEKALEIVLNKQNEGEVYQKTKIKVKLAKELPKRKEDLRIYLESMLNFDTILNATDTVALGFADSIIGSDDE